jgi:hypothetical protein
MLSHYAALAAFLLRALPQFASFVCSLKGPGYCRGLLVF